MDALKSAKIRLALAALLFAAWIGWLAYLVVTTRGISLSQPEVLSRPQFLVSQLDVIAEVARTDGNPPDVTISEVYWPKEEKKRAGEKIRVTNLSKCGEHEGWQGPGEYILPLIKSGKDSYEITPEPLAPGAHAGRLHIYRSTPQTRQQLEAMPKPVPAK